MHNADKDLGAAGAVGTPAYMSPEQLRGDPALVDQRSDIYALGILLCELMIGKPPYNFKTTDEAKTTLDAMGAKGTTAVIPSHLARELNTAAVKSRNAALQQNRSFWKELRGDLDAIVAKATSLSPDDRYNSVSELTEDINRHLKCLPLRYAIKPSRAVTAAKWLKRNAVGAAAAAVIFLLLSGMAVYLFKDYHKTKALNTQLDLAGSMLREKNTNLSNQFIELWRAQARSYSSALATYPVLQSQGKLGEARAVLAATRRSTDKGWEWYHLLGSSDQSDMVLGHSSSGFVLAKDTGPSVFGVAADHSVWFWQSKDGRFLRTNVHHKADVLECSSDGEHAYTLDAEGRMIVWSASSGEFRREYSLAVDGLGHGSQILEAIIDAKKRRIAARWQSGPDVRMGIFDLTKGEALCPPVPLAAESIICWREDGTLLSAEDVTLKSDSMTTYRVWRTADSGQPLVTVSESQLQGGGQTMSGLPEQIISRNEHEFMRFPGGLLLAQWKEGKLQITSAQVGKFEALAVAPGGDEGVVSLASQGLYRFTCSDKALTVLMEGKNGTIGRMIGHEGSVKHLSYGRDKSSVVVSAGQDGTLRLWTPSAVGESRLMSLRNQASGRWNVLSPSEQEGVSSSLYQRLTSSMAGWCRTIKDKNGQATLAVFDAPPWIMRSRHGDFGIQTCAPLEGFKTPPFLQADNSPELDKALHIVGVGASADGRLIALQRLHGDTGKIDVVTGDLLSDSSPTWVSPFFDRPSVDLIAMSDDGQWLVTNRAAKDSRGDELQVCDFRNGSGAPEQTVLNAGGTPLGTITAIEFSPVGGWFAAGNSQGQLFLWKLSEKGFTALSGNVHFKSGIQFISFSHQEDKIAVALADDPGQTGVSLPRGFAFIRLGEHDVRGEVVVPEDPQCMKVLSQDICWNPDGTRLASADTDGCLRIWAFRRDEAGQHIEDCTLVLELNEAQRDQVAAPLQTAAWSPDGRWLVASNADEGCYLYHGNSSEADAAAKPNRQVQLELDYSRNRVASIAQLRNCWQAIPDLKVDTLNPAAMSEAIDRIGVHPDEVTRWAWSELLRMKQQQPEKLVESRKDVESQKEVRLRYLNALECGTQDERDAARQICLALAHYRLNQFAQARNAISKAGNAPRSDRTALEALLYTQEGNKTKAAELLNAQENGRDPLTEPLWTELREELSQQK